MLAGCSSEAEPGRASQTIVNGQSAEQADMSGPLGAVVRINQFCSGTLVRADVVITSKHCLEEHASPDTYWVTAGMPRGPHSSQGANAYAVAQFWVHPEVDLAVLELERDVTEVQPLPIWEDRAPSSTYFSNGSDILTAGYGANGWRPEFVAEVGQAMGDADAMQDVVDRYWNNFWQAYTADGTMAYADTKAVHLRQDNSHGWVIQLESYLLSPATEDEGTTPLWGDSGGSFLREVNGQHYLVGTTQALYITGHEDGIIFRCFAVYTPAYVDWIEGLVGALSASCPEGTERAPDGSCRPVVVDHCESDGVICGPHGECVSGQDTYACECEAGFQNGVHNVDVQAACCQVVWLDADGDGFGDPESSFCAPEGVSGSWVDNSLDCNDGNMFSRPDRNEVCGDGMDNDCDGQVDETCGCNGDINGDGVIDYYDAEAYLLYIRDGVELPSYENADVNGDGEYNAGDAMLTVDLVLSGADCG